MALTSKVRATTEAKEIRTPRRSFTVMLLRSRRRSEEGGSAKRGGHFAARPGGADLNLQKKRRRFQSGSWVAGRLDSTRARKTRWLARRRDRRRNRALPKRGGRFGVSLCLSAAPALTTPGTTQHACHRQRRWVQSSSDSPARGSRRCSVHRGGHHSNDWDMIDDSLGGQLRRRAAIAAIIRVQAHDDMFQRSSLASPTVRYSSSSAASSPA